MGRGGLEEQLAGDGKIVEPVGALLALELSQTRPMINTRTPYQERLLALAGQIDKRRSRSIN